MQLVVSSLSLDFHLLLPPSFSSPAHLWFPQLFLFHFLSTSLCSSCFCSQCLVLPAHDLLCSLASFLSLHIQIIHSLPPTSELPLLSPLPLFLSPSHWRFKVKRVIKQQLCYTDGVGRKQREQKDLWKISFSLCWEPKRALRTKPACRATNQ